MFAVRLLNKEPLRFVTRDAWLAQPAVSKRLPLTLPVKQVRFETTASEPCNTQAACTFRMRFLQTFHIESEHKKDINFNFVVADDGNVYVGRGWEYRCDDEQFEGLIVGFVCQTKPTESQRKVAQELLTNGIKLGTLMWDYELTDDLK